MKKIHSYKFMRWDIAVTKAKKKYAGRKSYNIILYKIIQSQSIAMESNKQPFFMYKY